MHIEPFGQRMIVLLPQLMRDFARRESNPLSRGMILSTLLTLFVVPAAYSLFSRFEHPRTRKHPMQKLLLLALSMVAAVLPVGNASASVGKSLVIVGLGDSTTAGTPQFESPLESPPNGAGNPQSQYAYWMMKTHPEWTVINQGVNGQRSDEILARFDSSVLSHHPQIVVVLAGVNDLYQGYPPEAVIQNLKTIYARAKQAKIRVIACSIIPYNGMPAKIESRMRQVNEWIASYSADNGLSFCDLFKAVENPSRPGTLISTPDGLHPDVAGYRKMGEAITKVIEA
jgi:lysophospholipase L1-like esterase